MTVDQIPTVRTIHITKDQETGRKSINEYEIIQRLGNGHHGKVYLSRSKANGSKYAIKKISKITKINILNKNPDLQVTKILNEINIMKIIPNHPKILKLYKILNDFKSNVIYLVLEYCELGELQFHKIYADRYALLFIKSMIRDVALGLEFIHSLGIIHRDIKPSNLLLSHDKSVKISDFGISHIVSSINTKQDINTGFGTPAFLSPELCDSHEQNEVKVALNEKVDIWAFGVTVYCLVFRELPFVGNNEYDLFNKIAYETVDFSVDRLDLEDRVVEENEKALLIDLLKRMLEKDPKKRISLENIKKHRFVINNLNEKELSNFQKFNDQFIKPEPAVDVNLKKTNSIQRRFKSLFRRKHSSAESENLDAFEKLKLLVDPKPEVLISEPESDDESIPIPTHLSTKLTELSSSQVFQTNSPKKPAASTLSRPQLEKQKSSFTILPEDALLRNTKIYTPKPSPAKFPTSSNSLNLAQTLKKKTAGGDQFNGFSIYQNYEDSDDEDSDNSSIASFDSPERFAVGGVGDYGEDLTINKSTGSASIKRKDDEDLGKFTSINEYLDI